MKLLDQGKDQNGGVRQQVERSIRKLGSVQPSLVLTSSMHYVGKAEPKDSHAASIVASMADIVSEVAGDMIEETLDQSLVEECVEFSLLQMIAERKGEKASKVPTQCSRCLVQMSLQRCKIVVDGCLKYFPPGKVPNKFVLRTLGEVADTNPLKCVLYLNDILAKMIPSLGAVKKPNDRKEFTATFGYLCEAVIHAKSELEDVDTFKTDEFKRQFAICFDIVFAQWKKDKESKIRSSVLSTAGLMCEVMDEAKFKGEWKGIMESYIAAFKKDKKDGLYPISRGLSHCLKASIDTDAWSTLQSEELEPLIQTLLETITPLASQPVDYTDAGKHKAHTELLRCFEYLGKGVLAQEVHYILEQFQSKSSMMRVGSIGILRHLVNSLDEELESSRSLILASCVTLMEESNFEVRKSLVQLIMSMADKGYLNVQGGSQMVVLLVKQASTADRKAAPEPKGKTNKKGETKKKSALTPAELRQAADHILNIFSTKLSVTHAVMWPLLFECIVPKEYINGIGTICRVLSFIGRNKVKEDDPTYFIKWHEDANLPSPYAIMARLFVLLNDPFRSPRCGEFICSLLHSMAQIINPKFQEVLQENLPQCAKVLQENDPEQMVKWPNIVLKLFKGTLKAVSGNDDVLSAIGDALVDQFAFYKKTVLRKTALVYLGQVMMFSTHKNWVDKQIEFLTTALDKNNKEEIEGTAQGLGLAATTHLDTILTKLTVLITPPKEPPKKKKGWFNFGAQKKPTTPDDKKNLVLRSWGWICGYAQGNTLTSYMDAHITNNLTKLVKEPQKSSVNESMIKCIDRLSRSLRKNAPDFTLKVRDQYVKLMLDYTSSSYPAGVRANALECLSTLIQLRPALKLSVDGLHKEKCKEILDKVLLVLCPKKKAPPSDSGKRTPKKSKKALDVPKKASEEDNELVYENLKSVLLALLESCPTVESLLELLYRLEYHIISAQQKERQLSLTMYLAVIKKFMNLLRSGISMKDDYLKKLGLSMANITPRLNDGVPQIRNTALEIAQMLLYVDQLLHHPSDDPTPSEDLKTLTSLKQNLVAEPVPLNRVNAAGEVAKIYSVLISSSEFKSLILGLIPGVNDCDEQSSLGCCRVIRVLLEQRGNEVAGYLEKIVDKYLFEMIKLISNDSRERLKVYLEIIVVLAQTHFEKVVDTLLKKDLPLSKQIIKCFQSIAKEEELADQLLQKIVFMLNNTAVHETEINAPIAAATTALKSIIDISTIKDLIPDNYWKLYTTCVTRIGTATKTSVKKKKDTGKGKSKDKKGKDGKKNKGAELAKKATATKSGVQVNVKIEDVQADAVELLEAFLRAAGNLNVLHDANEDNLWPKLKQKDYEEGLQEFSEIYCKHHPDQLEQLFAEAQPMMRKHYLGQRLTVTCMAAVWTKHCGSNFQLLQQIVSILLPRVSDPAPRVRKMALIGLANVKTVWQDELTQFALSILNQSSSAMEDQVQDVAAAAVRCLSQILTVLEIETVQPSLITICFSTRKYLNHPNDGMREETYRLFASLCRFGVDMNRTNFEEQVHQNIVAIIVHLADTSSEVGDSALECFRTVAEYFEDEAMIECATNSSSGQHNYDRVLNSVCPILTGYHHDRLTLYVQSALTYFKDDRNHIRANAALLAGKLASEIENQEMHSHDISEVVENLCTLLKTKAPDVRQAAAAALSHLGAV